VQARADDDFGSAGTDINVQESHTAVERLAQLMQPLRQI
jgi:hypothetical protein